MQLQQPCEASRASLHRLKQVQHKTERKCYRDILYDDASGEPGSRLQNADGNLNARAGIPPLLYELPRLLTPASTARRLERDRARIGSGGLDLSWPLGFLSSTTHEP